MFVSDFETSKCHPEIGKVEGLQRLFLVWVGCVVWCGYPCHYFLSHLFTFHVWNMVYFYIYCTVCRNMRRLWMYSFLGFWIDVLFSQIKCQGKPSVVKLHFYENRGSFKQNRIIMAWICTRVRRQVICRVRSIVSFICRGVTKEPWGVK